MPTTDDSSDPTFIVLYSEPTRDKEQRRIVLDATEQEVIATHAQLTEKGIQSQRTISVRTNSKGERLYTGIWSSEGSPAGRLPDPLDPFRKQLASFEKLPAEKFDDPR